MVTLAALIVAAKVDAGHRDAGRTRRGLRVSDVSGIDGALLFPILHQEGAWFGVWWRDWQRLRLRTATVSEALPVIMGFVKLFMPDRIASTISDTPWGAYPLTIHSAGWGIFFNMLVAVLVSYLWPDGGEDRERKASHHRFVQAVSGISQERRRQRTLGLAVHRGLVSRGLRALCRGRQYAVRRPQCACDVGPVRPAVAVGLAVVDACLRHFRHVVPGVLRGAFQARSARARGGGAKGASGGGRGRRDLIRPAVTGRIEAFTHRARILHIDVWSEIEKDGYTVWRPSFSAF